MAELKTNTTAVNVESFLAASPRADDGRALKAMMERVSGEPAAMWGPSIVGFGRYRYRYDSGHEGEAARIGFSPRKAAISLYLTCDLADHADALARLGKHKTGKGCLYVTKLADVDTDVLEALVAAALADNRARYPEG